MAALSGCGGGGGGGSGAGPSPVPTVPVTTPTPAPTAIPTPTPASGQVELILAEDDRLAGTGIEVGDIEDAALGEGGSMAVVVTVAGARGARAVLRRSPEAAYATLFGPEPADPGLNPATLARARMSPGGDVLFEAGAGLDSDRLYRASAAVTQPLAGVAPGVAPPTFRILGDVAMGRTGRVGFIGGGSPCEVTTTGDTTRVRCTGHLFVADDFSVTEIEAEGLDLEDTSPSSPQVAVADSGAVYFSVPGSGSAPTLLRYGEQGSEVLLGADTDVDPVGVLVRPQVEAVNAAENLLLAATLRDDPPPTRPTVLGILRGGSFEVVAREGEQADGSSIEDLRAIGLDDAGDALYLATLGSAQDPAAPRRSLRLGDAQSFVEIATEGAIFPGSDLTLLSIGSPRLNRPGDVAFLAELGRQEPGTTIVEETRAVVRRADGSLLSPISSRGAGPVGPVSAFKVAGFGDDAALLLIGSLDSSGRRVLVLVSPNAP